MTRPQAATAATVVVLGVLLAAGIWRRQPAIEASPKDPIYAMLDAARAGDDKAYLAQYTGAMAGQLKRAIEEKTAAGFQTYLKSSNGEIKGVAISEPQSTSDSEASVRVEYIYQDRNEVQTIFVEKTGVGWKIARVDSAERVKTLVPYGTPVQ